MGANFREMLVFLILEDAVLWIRRFLVSVRKLTVSKFVFVEGVNSLRSQRLPTNTTKIKPLQILIIP